MVKIIWTKRAKIDLNDIADYISKGSEKYAKITIQSLIEATKILEKHPLIGRIVPEYDNEKFRELIRGNYRIIYKYAITDIYILTIHHAARDLLSRNII